MIWEGLFDHHEPVMLPAGSKVEILVATDPTWRCKLCDTAPVKAAPAEGDDGEKWFCPKCGVWAVRNGQSETPVFYALPPTVRRG